MTNEPTCQYCQEPASYTGPQRNGTENAYLLRATDTEDGLHDATFPVFVFCSAECRQAWVDAVGNELYDTRTFSVADDIPVDRLTDD